jgi:chemotaxis regulatin CheY-phosphate phosphatase CheZ
MMELKTNMENIFEKLGDLKAFFIYGQQLIPILQKIIDFMQSTVPLLENVNREIQDSTSKIPKAALQLNSVTNATEVATTEILDVVDGITSDIHGMKGKLECLKTRLGDDDDLGTLIGMVGKIETRMMDITISLQVQDITSQQLSSVNHLIQSIQEKLSSLVQDLESKEHTDIPNIDLFPRDGAFNADARYEKNTKSQELVDSLIVERKSSGKTSQEEIDKLFANQ